MSTSFDSSGAGTSFVVEERRHDTTAVLSCSGDIDMPTAPLLEEALASAQTNQPSAVIVDLSAVDFLASIGMGLLKPRRKGSRRGWASRWWPTDPAPVDR